MPRTLNFPLIRYQNRSSRYSEDQLDPESEAAFLFNKIKVFCLVFPTNAGVIILLLIWVDPYILA